MSTPQPAEVLLSQDEQMALKLVTILEILLNYGFPTATAVNVLVVVPSFLLILWKVVPNRSACQPYHILLYVESIFNLITVVGMVLHASFLNSFDYPPVQVLNDPLQSDYDIIFNFGRSFIQIFIVLSAIVWMQILRGASQFRLYALALLIPQPYITIYAVECLMGDKEQETLLARILDKMETICCLVAVAIHIDIVFYCRKCVLQLQTTPGNMKGRRKIAKGLFIKMIISAIPSLWTVTDVLYQLAVFAGRETKTGSAILFIVGLMFYLPGCLFCALDSLATVWMFSRYIKNRKASTSIHIIGSSTARETQSSVY